MTYASVVPPRVSWGHPSMGDDGNDDLYVGKGFGKKLADARKRKGLTQQSAAERIGIASGTLSKYETGDLGMGVEILGKLADLYEVSTDSLLGRSIGGGERVVNMDAVSPRVLAFAWRAVETGDLPRDRLAAFVASTNSLRGENASDRELWKSLEDFLGESDAKGEVRAPRQGGPKLVRRQ